MNYDLSVPCCFWAVSKKRSQIDILHCFPYFRGYDIIDALDNEVVSVHARAR